MPRRFEAVISLAACDISDAKEYLLGLATGDTCRLSARRAGNARRVLLLTIAEIERQILASQLRAREHEERQGK